MDKHADKQLNLLAHIKNVDAPPFLMTRIHQKIETAYRNRFSPRLAFGLVAVFVLVVVLNIFVITTYCKQNREDMNLAQSMNLMPNNSLYR
jgi:hypothetical protein